jgi:hypothetical protein
MLKDRWYQRYVDCFSVSNRFHLPSPIPDNIKAYLRGTLRVYWGWALTVLGGVHSILAAFTLYHFYSTGQKLTAKYTLHTCGTCSLVTFVIFTAWTVQYYSFIRSQLLTDLDYLVVIYGKNNT